MTESDIFEDEMMKVEKEQAEFFIKSGKVYSILQNGIQIDGEFKDVFIFNIKGEILGLSKSSDFFNDVIFYKAPNVKDQIIKLINLQNSKEVLDQELIDQSSKLCEYFNIDKGDGSSLMFIYAEDVNLEGSEFNIDEIDFLYKDDNFTIFDGEYCEMDDLYIITNSQLLRPKGQSLKQKR